MPFIEIDGKPVTDSENVLVIFAAILNAVFCQKLRIDLIPTRFGIGKNPVKIEDNGKHQQTVDSGRPGVSMLTLAVVF
ncbi:MAG TPA: hypothetical protein VJ719_01255 [Chthoniobacterales bacterium]|nr:hypothetical protein [Chthoniobacterales bacterium]